MAARFDLVDMQLMVNVAGAMSLTKGAERTFLSVSAASNRVKGLEDSLGTALLYRGSQGVTLTPSGEVFVKHARTVLRQLDYLRGEIQEYAEGVKGRVRLYANTTALNEFIPDVLGRYLVTHPDVNVELRERLSYQVVKAVVDGGADIGITAQSSGGMGIRYLPYRKDRLTLVTWEDHPLARGASCTFEQTLDFDFICLFESSAIHSLLLKAAEDLGRILRFRVEVGNNFETVCRLVAAKVGIGVIPASAAYRYARDIPIRVVPLDDAWSLRNLYLCVRDAEPLPAFAQELVDLLVSDAASAQDPVLGVA